MAKGTGSTKKPAATASIRGGRSRAKEARRSRSRSGREKAKDKAENKERRNSSKDGKIKEKATNLRRQARGGLASLDLAPVGRERCEVEGVRHPLPIDPLQSRDRLLPLLGCHF